MRSILELPEISTTHFQEAKDLVNQLGLILEENVFTQTDAGEVLFEEPEVAQEAQAALAQLNTLAGKTFPLLKFDRFWENTPLEDMVMGVLQPKAPAVHDMTLDEATEIVESILSGCFEDHELAYYLELFKNSFLLDDVPNYIFNPITHGLPLDATPVEIARRMMDDGREGSAILRV